MDDKAIEVLKTRRIDAHPIWVFLSDVQEPKKVGHRVIKKAGLKDFRIHDLRRIFGSWMAMDYTICSNKALQKL